METDIELIIKEYEECNRGYAYRDALTHTVCRDLIQTFYVFFTLLVAAYFLEVSIMVHCFFCLVLGCAGLLSMVTLLIDLESTVSSKIALRCRSQALERQLSSKSSSAISMWDAIDNRKEFMEEKIFKLNRDRDEPEYKIFVNCIRILIVLWVIVIILVAIWWPVKYSLNPENSPHEHAKIEDIQNPDISYLRATRRLEGIDIGLMTS